MENTRNLEKSDKWIVGVTFLCALLLFSWLIYDIAFLNPQLQGQVPVGKIYEVQNKVKRKFNKSLIWYPAENNEVVYEDDWIFTSSLSIAKIKLDSGGEIIIEPDSLIILSRSNGVLQLDLQHGRLMADVKGDDIKINVLKDGKLQAVDTNKGAVQISQKDKKGESLNLDSDKDGKNDLTISELADRKFYEAKEGFSDLDKNGLSYKVDNNYEAELYEGQKLKMQFDWIDPQGQWAEYEIQVSRDPNFNGLLSTSKGDQSIFEMAIDESGTYYWRVRGFDENGKASSWSQQLVTNVSLTTLEKGEPVRLSRNSMLYELNKEELNKVKPDRSYDPSEDKPVTISWEPSENASNYRVQLSAKEDFSDILHETITKDNSLTLKNIQLGNTHFRVIPENNDGVSIAKAATGKVMTYFPPPDENTLKTLDKNEYQVLKWGKVPYAEAYKVTYKTGPDQEEQSKIVTGTQLKVSENTGFLQWKVRVVDPETKKSMSSNSATVDWYDKAKRLASVIGSGQAGSDYPKIVKPAPRKTFISVNGSPLFIVMNWTYEKDTRSYEVEVSRKPDMTDLVFKKEVVGKKRAVINQVFKPGIYYIRVRALQDKVTDERWSETEVFRVINRNAG